MLQKVRPVSAHFGTWGSNFELVKFLKSLSLLKKSFLDTDGPRITAKGFALELFKNKINTK